MGDADHKLMVRRLIEDLFNQGRYEVLDEVLAASWVIHSFGKTQDRAEFEKYRTACCSSSKWRPSRPASDPPRFAEGTGRAEMTGTIQGSTSRLTPGARRTAAQRFGEASGQRTAAWKRRRLRIGGIFLITGSALWQPMLGWEHLKDLGQRSSVWVWYADQGGFLVAMGLLLIGMVSLDRARFAGASVVGRLAMHGLALAWALLVIAEVGDLARWGAADALTGIGGLLTYPTTLVAGIVAVRGGQLTGWRRWPLLGLGGYQIGVLLIPLLLAAAEPSWPAEAGWQLGWLTVGVAAVQHGRRTMTAAPAADQKGTRHGQH
jgi:hypothetical protein